MYDDLLIERFAEYSKENPGDVISLVSAAQLYGWTTSNSVNTWSFSLTPGGTRTCFEEVDRVRHESANVVLSCGDRKIIVSGKEKTLVSCIIYETSITTALLDEIIDEAIDEIDPAEAVKVAAKYWGIKVAGAVAERLARQ